MSGSLRIGAHPGDRTTKDLDEILERHVVQGKRVERLLLHPDQEEHDEERLNGPEGRVAE